MKELTKKLDSIKKEVESSVDLISRSYLDSISKLINVEQKSLFKKLYTYSDLKEGSEKSIEDVVKDLPMNKVAWATSQVENTLIKNSEDSLELKSLKNKFEPFSQLQLVEPQPNFKVTKTEKMTDETVWFFYYNAEYLVGLHTVTVTYNEYRSPGSDYYPVLINKLWYWTV